jgi:hypothetical protein
MVVPHHLRSQIVNVGVCLSVDQTLLSNRGSRRILA